MVTHFFPSHGGGIELVAKNLCEAYVREGKAVVWISSDGDPPPPNTPCMTAIATASFNGLEKATGLPFPVWTPKSVGILWDAIGDSDVVHIHELVYLPSILALLVARLKGKPTVITQHTGAIRLHSRILTVVYRLYARAIAALAVLMSARLVFISDNARRFFRLEHRASLIFNGVNTDIFGPAAPEHRLALRRQIGVAEDRRVVLFVGRFVRKKGLPIVETLSALYPDICWVLAGSGPLNPRHWNRPNVRVFDYLPPQKLAELYQLSDLLILPSDTEGFPLVVQEALCCGTGVLSTAEVATACPPIHDLIRYCNVKPGTESVPDWSAALLDILNDESYMDRRTERSREARANWSWHRCARSYFDLFQGDAESLPTPSATSTRNSIPDAPGS